MLLQSVQHYGNASSEHLGQFRLWESGIINQIITPSHHSRQGRKKRLSVSFQTLIKCNMHSTMDDNDPGKIISHTYYDYPSFLIHFLSYVTS